MIASPRPPTAHPNAGFIPFTPKCVEVPYASPPAGPKVYITGPDISSGPNDVPCGTSYPYDPRNFSLLQGGIGSNQNSPLYGNRFVQVDEVCAANPLLSRIVAVPLNTFYGTSQAQADALATLAATQKALYLLQQQGCKDVLFANTDQSFTATCQPGTIGDAVTVTIPQGSYFSPISQAAADALAATVAHQQALAGLSCTQVQLPQIQLQPVGGQINSGQTFTLFSAASGVPAPTYQWYLGNSGDQSQPIVGANFPAYTTLALLLTSSFWVQAVNAYGSANSNTATVIVGAAPTAPVIVSAPSGGTVKQPSSFTLSVVAIGTPTLTYQWYLGFTGDTTQPVAGATNNSYTITTNTATPGSYNYWVKVTNGLGSTNSPTAVVVIQNNPPTVVVTWIPLFPHPSTPFTLTASVSGIGVLGYQWYVGLSGDTSSPIVGATNSSLPRTAGGPGTEHFWCQVAGLYGNGNSNTASVIVQP